MALPITSGGTTAIARGGGQTPRGYVGAPLVVRSLSFATPMAEPVTTTTAASNSVSSLSQSTKEASKTSKTSAGKRDGPSTAKSSDKRMKSTNDDYDLDKEDKEADYVPITNDASSNLMEGKTLEQDPLILEKHRKAFYLKAFPPPRS